MCIRDRLYVILKPVNRGLALLAALWRFTFMLMWLVMTLHLFDALRLLKAADSLQAFDAEQLQALASFNLGTRLDYYYVGLLFGDVYKRQDSLRAAEAWLSLLCPSPTPSP